jgi:hypothetical protein
VAHRRYGYWGHRRWGYGYGRAGYAHRHIYAYGARFHR